MLARILFASFLCLLAANGAERRVVVPANSAPPVGPYSPGILAGDFLYVSGQGVRRPDGSVPGTLAEQTRQCLENVKAIVEAAGLTMNDVVYTQLYVERLETIAVVNDIYRGYFREPYPARATVGVDRMPTGTTVEINAVAIRTGGRRAVGLTRGEPASPGMIAGGRLFLSSVYGTSDADVDRRVDTMLRRAGFPRDRMVSSTRYSIRAGRERIPVKELPGGAAHAMTGVWAKNAAQPKAGCALAGDTLYCSAAAGSGPDIEAQVKAVMSRIEMGLKAQGFGFEHVTASNVFLDNLDEFQRMNAIYGSFFGAAPPTRTTVQPARASDRASGATPMVRIAVVAVK